MTIAQSDASFETHDCGTWTRLYGTMRSSASDGDHAVGVHLRTGLYTAPRSAGGCYWARLSGFSGLLDDILDNDLTFGGRQYVQIHAGDVGFSSSGCGTWTRVGN